MKEGEEPQPKAAAPASEAGRQQQAQADDADGPSSTNSLDSFYGTSVAGPGGLTDGERLRDAVRPLLSILQEWLRSAYYASCGAAKYLLVQGMGNAMPVCVYTAAAAQGGAGEGAAEAFAGPGADARQVCSAIDLPRHCVLLYDSHACDAVLLIHKFCVGICFWWRCAEQHSGPCSLAEELVSAAQAAEAGKGLQRELASLQEEFKQVCAPSESFS